VLTCTGACQTSCCIVFFECILAIGIGRRLGPKVHMAQLLWLLFVVLLLLLLLLLLPILIYTDLSAP